MKTTSRKRAAKARNKKAAEKRFADNVSERFVPTGTTITPEEIVRWRRGLPGEGKQTFFTARDGTLKPRPQLPGWTQQQSANWAGVHIRSWQRWESGEVAAPKWVVLAMQRHSFSFEDMLDRALNTPLAQVERDGGVYPELAAEQKRGDDQ